MGAFDWLAPLGTAGRMQVRELVLDESVHQRALRTEDVREIALAEISLLGRALTAEVGHRTYRLRDGDDVVARLGPPSGRGVPWTGDLAGQGLTLTHERVDLQPDPGSKAQQVLFLLVRSAEHSWVVHYVGGRLAGDHLVISRGDVPFSSPAVVTCVPAARSRDLPRPRLRRRDPADEHATSWTAEATGAEVALAELVVLAGLHNHVDHLAAAFAGTARDVAGIWRVFTPVPEPLPTKRDD
jgi:hypothetical protein